MHRHRTVAVLAVAALSLALYGCAETSSQEAVTQLAATIQEVKGTGLNRVILTPQAVDRVGIVMRPIAGPAGAEVVPYSAVVYDSVGKAWVYVSAKPRTYQRKLIRISDITGESVTFSGGPEVGTPVVTRGAAELYGAESEIGAEEPE